MNLLGEVLTKITLPILIPRITIPLALSVLETAVSFIQAYVFITLITLYTTETK